ncbi:hypothetical protein Purlil1_7040 [Purpureocillium lilacinum]|uniref:Uncharacterized protein n=1 Tax=Purpureocillium lilacinum TaxID=33203 RepID=A0ABR0BWR6_PURLI|nr:hypothetical protein Purlil1_7040 [Purpureocillium lilacinum]
MRHRAGDVGQDLQIVCNKRKLFRQAAVADGILRAPAGLGTDAVATGPLAPQAHHGSDFEGDVQALHTMIDLAPLLGALAGVRLAGCALGACPRGVLVVVDVVALHRSRLVQPYTVGDDLASGAGAVLVHGSSVTQRNAARRMIPVLTRSLAHVQRRAPIGPGPSSASSVSRRCYAEGGEAALGVARVVGRLPGPRRFRRPSVHSAGDLAPSLPRFGVSFLGGASMRGYGQWRMAKVCVFRANACVRARACVSRACACDGAGWLQKSSDSVKAPPAASWEGRERKQTSGGLSVEEETEADSALNPLINAPHGGIAPAPSPTHTNKASSCFGCSSRAQLRGRGSTRKARPGTWHQVRSTCSTDYASGKQEVQSTKGPPITTSTRTSYFVLCAEYPTRRPGLALAQAQGFASSLLLACLPASQPVAHRWSARAPAGCGARQTTARERMDRRRRNRGARAGARGEFGRDREGRQAGRQQGEHLRSCLLQQTGTASNCERSSIRRIVHRPSGATLTEQLWTQAEDPHAANKNPPIVNPPPCHRERGCHPSPPGIPPSPLQFPSAPAPGPQKVARSGAFPPVSDTRAPAVAKRTHARSGRETCIHAPAPPPPPPLGIRQAMRVLTDGGSGNHGLPALARPVTQRLLNDFNTYIRAVGAWLRTSHLPDAATTPHIERPFLQLKRRKFTPTGNCHGQAGLVLLDLQHDIPSGKLTAALSLKRQHVLTCKATHE